MDGEHEQQPLLRPSQPPPPPQSSSPSIRRPAEFFKFLICVAIVALFQGAMYLIAAPIMQLKEYALCRRFYNGSNISVERQDCKVPSVQNDLALLIGWQQVFDCLPGIVTGIAYGAMADRLGRKPVLSLAFSGILVAAIWTQVVLSWPLLLPTSLTWLSSGFLFIGGGPVVATSITFVVVSDVSQPVQRSSNFFYLNAVALLAEIAATPLASKLSQHSTWLPARIALGLLLLTTMLIFFVLPETLDKDLGLSAPQEQEDSRENDDNNSAASPKLGSYRTLQIVRQQVQEFSFIWRSMNLLLLVIAFFAGNLYRSWQDFFLQYVSKRYGLEIYQAAYLLSYRAAVNFILLVAILPGINYVLEHRLHFDMAVKDLALTRASTILLMFGSLCIALAPSLPMVILGVTLSALGHGFVPVILSLASSLLDQRRLGKLYSTMALSEMIGNLVVGPVLAGTMILGSRIGGFLAGLPFLAASGIFLLVTGAMMAVDLRRPRV